MLIATFSKPDEGPHHISVIRRTAEISGSVDWSCPRYSNLPHDMVHLMVESVFLLPNGFWGRVELGDIPSELDKTGPELLQAEALAAVHWFDSSQHDAMVCDAIYESCDIFSIAPPASCCLERVAMARAALTKLRSAWRESGVMTLQFGRDEPLAAFALVLNAADPTAR